MAMIAGLRGGGGGVCWGARPVLANARSGIRSGVNGTPCFFINGRRHDAAWDAATLSAAIAMARNDDLVQTIPIR